MRFSEKPFDDEEMNRLPSSAHPFVPTDEIPDDRPDPSEALMMKEEEEDTTPQKESIETNGKVDRNDLGRVPSYMGKEFTEKLPVPFNGKPELSTESDKIVNAVEEAEARAKVPTDLGNRDYLSESHGKRGRKPAYKDRRKTPLA